MTSVNTQQHIIFRPVWVEFSYNKTFSWFGCLLLEVFHGFPVSGCNDHLNWRIEQSPSFCAAYFFQRGNPYRYTCLRKYRIRLLNPSENSWIRFGICYWVLTHRLKDLQQTTSRTWSAESTGNRSHLEAMKTLTPKILGIKKNTGESIVCGICWNRFTTALETWFFAKILPNLLHFTIDLGPQNLDVMMNLAWGAFSFIAP